MQLVIIAPTGILCRTTVDKVSLPGACGAFTVLPRHASLIARLGAGTIRYEEEGKTVQIDIEGGFAQVHKDQIDICAELPGKNNDLQTDDQVES